MLEYEAEGRSPVELAQALAARDRSLAGSSAPARGLFLERVV
jgi:tRNA U38,U39,U40 pseudouridine synthase TruA